MQVTVEDAGALRKQITISYDATEVRQREDSMLTRYSSQAKMNGFRNGKAPLSLLRKRYGAAGKAEASENLLNEGFRKAISDHKLEPIGPLNTDERQENDGLKLLISFDVRPEITLPEASSIDLPQEDTSASNDEIQQELDNLAARSGEHEDITEGEGLVAEDIVTLSGKIMAGDETVR